MEVGMAAKANAIWNGSLKEGKGSMRLGSGAFEGAYSFRTRFEGAPGTNPEELIGAALAGCFSMALSADLGKGGTEPKEIRTHATVHLEKVGEGFGITRIELDCEAEIPGMDDAAFQTAAEGAKKNCPVSKALAGVEISLEAKLVGS
jgi:lipoyl-dependent peroxiredoxin